MYETGKSYRFSSEVGLERRRTALQYSDCIHQVHKIELERLSALIMRGDCVHAGAEYLHRDQLNNLRFHAYVTTAIYSPREDNELVTLFRKTRKETNAEKKKRDFSLVMKCH